MIKTITRNYKGYTYTIREEGSKKGQLLSYIAYNNPSLTAYLADSGKDLFSDSLVKGVLKRENETTLLFIEPESIDKFYKKFEIELREKKCREIIDEIVSRSEPVFLVPHSNDYRNRQITTTATTLWSAIELRFDKNFFEHKLNIEEKDVDFCGELFGYGTVLKSLIPGTFNNLYDLFITSKVAEAEELMKKGEKEFFGIRVKENFQ